MLEHFIKKANIFCFSYMRRGERGKQMKWVKRDSLIITKKALNFRDLGSQSYVIALWKTQSLVFVSSFHQKLVERHGECVQTETPVKLSIEPMCWTQLSPKKYSPCRSKPISSPFCKAPTCNDSVSRSAASDIRVTVLICQSHNSAVSVLLLWIGSDQEREAVWN